MSYGTSTHAQRLQWQYEEGRHGYDADPSLEEQFQIADDEFQRWDTMTFSVLAPAAHAVERDDWRGGVAVTPPDHGRSDPANSSRPAAMEASTLPLASSRSAARGALQPPPSEGAPLASSSWQNWLWTA